MTELKFTMSKADDQEDRYVILAKDEYEPMKAEVEAFLGRPVDDDYPDIRVAAAKITFGQSKVIGGFETVEAINREGRLRLL